MWYGGQTRFRSTILSKKILNFSLDRVSFGIVLISQRFGHMREWIGLARLERFLARRQFLKTFGQGIELLAKRVTALPCIFKLIEQVQHVVQRYSRFIPFFLGEIG